MYEYLRCPSCREPLTPASGGLGCPRGHRFDTAAKGYTNLLLGHRARHGDSREMLLSRRRFLDAGYYAPLAGAICETARARLFGGARILDAGCGEGYYTACLADAMRGAELVGIDISAEAIRLAASRPAAKRGQLALYVAGVYDMPFSDRGFDCVLSVFSPFAREEFLRVLRPGGLLISAIPLESHLLGLKRVLYDTPYPNTVAPYALPGFTLLGERRVETSVQLSREAAQDLFAMTPYYHRTPPAGRERLAALSSLDTELAFAVLAYRKEE